eukprot:gb/GECG01014672.1/.p1 GENE.gb/GECG01014672.1/~~gb/GECG01014672.1/.p1  ORF type:complete len:971 (+),score=68.52 gb/GECG01014672.1/:1-2913(+)
MTILAHILSLYNMVIEVVQSFFTTYVVPMLDALSGLGLSMPLAWKQYVFQWMYYSHTQLELITGEDEVAQGAGYRDTHNFLSAFPFMYNAPLECFQNGTISMQDDGTGRAYELLESPEAEKCLWSWVTGTPLENDSLRLFLTGWLTIGVCEVLWTVTKRLLVQVKARGNIDDEDDYGLEWMPLLVPSVVIPLVGTFLYWSTANAASAVASAELFSNFFHWLLQLTQSMQGVLKLLSAVIGSAVAVGIASSIYRAILLLVPVALRMWTLSLIASGLWSVIRVLYGGMLWLLQTRTKLSESSLDNLTILAGAVTFYVLLYLLFWKKHAARLWRMSKSTVDMMIVEQTSLFCVLFPVALALGLGQVGIEYCHWFQFSIHALLLLYCSPWSKSIEKVKLRTVFLGIPFRAFCMSRLALLLLAVYKPEIGWNLVQTILSYLRNGLDNVSLGLLGSITPALGNVLTELPSPVVCFGACVFMVSSFIIYLQLPLQSFSRVMLFGGAHSVSSALFEWSFVVLMKVFVPSIELASLGVVGMSILVGIFSLFLNPEIKAAAPWMFPVHVDTLCGIRNRFRETRLLENMSKTLWDSLLMQMYLLLVVNLSKVRECDKMHSTNCIQQCLLSFQLSYTFPLLWLTVPLGICTLLHHAEDESPRTTNQTNERSNESPKMIQYYANESGTEGQSNGRYGSRRRKSISRQRKFATEAYQSGARSSGDYTTFRSDSIPRPSAPDPDYLSMLGTSVHEREGVESSGVSSDRYTTEFRAYSHEGRATSGVPQASHASDFDFMHSNGGQRRPLFGSSSGFAMPDTPPRRDGIDISQAFGATTISSPGRSQAPGNFADTSHSHVGVGGPNLSTYSDAAQSHIGVERSNLPTCSDAVSTPPRSSTMGHQPAGAVGSQESTSSSAGQANNAKSPQDLLWEQFGDEDEEILLSQSELVEELERRGYRGGGGVKRPLAEDENVPESNGDKRQRWA